MPLLQFARDLVAIDSTCHRSNAAASDYVERVLRELGFATERIVYQDSCGVPKVNIVGRKGQGPGGLAFFSHTDVVPADDWHTDQPGPFEPVVRDGRLVGRGSTDMKGPLACMLAAAEQLGSRSLKAPLYVSCTADEEINHAGIEAVAGQSQIFQELVAGGARGIVGEPTRLQVVYAHKGGCRFTVTAHGRAAHSSTRQGLNANLAMIPFLVELKAIHDETESAPQWLNHDFDPPTICWNIGINDHNRATNITAPQSIATVGFRPMPGTDTEGLLARVRSAADRQGLEFQLDALHAPFHRERDSDFVREAVTISRSGPPHTVGYGTEASNLGRVQSLIVLGPGDIAQAHTHDEWIALEQLERGQEVYGAFIRHYCLDGA